MLKKVYKRLHGELVIEQCWTFTVESMQERGVRILTYSKKKWQKIQKEKKTSHKKTKEKLKADKRRNGR